MRVNEYWTDDDFGYDRQRDFTDESCSLQLEDGTTLYDVSVLKKPARYSVHFCLNAEQIWIVDVEKLRAHLQWRDQRLDEFSISYSPRRRADGNATARGYIIPCRRVREFGFAWDLPKQMVTYVLQGTNKEQRGQLAEEALLILINEWRYFPRILVSPAGKAAPDDDKKRGIDFWVDGETPIQLKLETRAGEGKPNTTGNLFFQTHTLPVSQAKSWHGYEYAMV